MDQTNQEKRQKRLIKNKESARKSRNRKKHYQEFLENRVKVLMQEATNLRNSIYIKSEELEKRDQIALDTRSRIESFLEKLISSCNQRKDNIRFIIDEIIEIMIPAHAKLLMMICEKTDIEVPELNNSQLKIIQDLQPVIVQEQGKLKEVVTEMRNINNELDGILDWAGQLPCHLRGFLSNEKIVELLGGDSFNS